MLAEIFGVDGIVVIVVVAVVLLFGGTALPKLARGLGSARHEFESGLREGAPAELAAGEAGAPGLAVPQTSTERQTSFAEPHTSSEPQAAT
jgi:sec-independent protein translocase protein TatA